MQLTTVVHDVLQGDCTLFYFTSFKETIYSRFFGDYKAISKMKSSRKKR